MAMMLESHPFASGGFKECFSFNFQRNGKCGAWVIKRMKADRYKQGYRISQLDIRVQDLAVALVEKFDSEARYIGREDFGDWHDHGPRRSGLHVLMLASEMCRFTGKNFVSPDGTPMPWIQGEHLMKEKALSSPENFEKFNSNSGWSNPRGRNVKHLVPDALSHWSWVHSRGKMLLCDLQGTQYCQGDEFKIFSNRIVYQFTDPVIMSPEGQFGCTDLGSRGICVWFQRHVCNDLCRDLGLQGQVPQALGRPSRHAALYGTSWR